MTETAAASKLTQPVGEGAHAQGQQRKTEKAWRHGRILAGPRRRQGLPGRGGEGVFTQVQF